MTPEKFRHDVEGVRAGLGTAATMLLMGRSAGFYLGVIGRQAAAAESAAPDKLWVLLGDATDGESTALFGAHLEQFGPPNDRGFGMTLEQQPRASTLTETQTARLGSLPLLCQGYDILSGYSLEETARHLGEPQPLGDGPDQIIPNPPFFRGQAISPLSSEL